MIQAKELMLGNWVNAFFSSTSERYVEVDINILLQIVGNPDWINVQPIPLTPEILIACGFEDDILPLKDTPNLESDNQTSYLSYDYMEKEIGIYIHARRTGQEGSQYWIHCPYVHQLQNLYYSLTNSELKINL